MKDVRRESDQRSVTLLRPRPGRGMSGPMSGPRSGPSHHRILRSQEILENGVRRSLVLDRPRLVPLEDWLESRALLDDVTVVRLMRHVVEVLVVLDFRGVPTPCLEPGRVFVDPEGPAAYVLPPGSELVPVVEPLFGIEASPSRCFEDLGALLFLIATRRPFSDGVEGWHMRHGFPMPLLLNPRLDLRVHNLIERLLARRTSFGSYKEVLDELREIESTPGSGVHGALPGTGSQSRPPVTRRAGKPGSGRPVKRPCTARTRPATAKVLADPVVRQMIETVVLFAMAFVLVTFLPVG